MYAFHANEPTKVECTLVHAQNALLIQSQRDEMGRAHSDGWGIGYYQSGHPIVERNAGAAHQGLHFSNTAERVFARAVIAHVRLATVGIPAIYNCHPFRWGSWIFAHNGTLTAEARLRTELEAEMGEEFAGLIHGSTDSELMFHWLVSRLRDEKVINAEECFDLGKMRDALDESISQLDRRNDLAGATKPAKLNFVMTNGEILVATRLGNSLHYVYRQGLHDCEICGIPHVAHDNNVSYRAVVVASEPLSNEDWKPLPDRSIITVAADISITLSPLSGSSRSRGGAGS
jgi:glutamine amidotransferase